MVDWTRLKNSRGALVASAVGLLALGAAGGASAVQATRPAVEMAPNVQMPIAKLPTARGVVSVKGRITEIYGDRFVMQDASGRAMIAMGREGQGTVRVGQAVLVQGRFDNGQLHASYLVDQNGQVVAAGPRPGGPEGSGGPGDHRQHGPGPDGPPPSPPGCPPVPVPVPRVSGELGNAPPPGESAAVTATPGTPTGASPLSAPPIAPGG